MEHSCHKCGQPVEDGVPFCSQCGAPQIRVAMPEPAVTLGTSGTAAASPVPEGIPQITPRMHLPLRWTQALQPCALAALLAFVAMLLGLKLPAAALGAGFLAVVLYRRRDPGTMIKAGIGARLGAASGFLCFMFSGIFMAIAATVPDVRAKLREQMLEAIQKAASRSNDAQVQAAVQILQTPEGLAMMVILAAVLFILLATIGGALGGAFLSRRNRT
jgi:hypothetical protein